jgi:Transglutaminase-like superfamily
MTRDLYRTPADMSDAGRQAWLFEDLPDDAGELAKIVQGLLIHQHIAPAYGVTLSQGQLAESHVRGVEPMLERIADRDSKPLFRPRPEARRLVGVCRHFTLLHVAMLRVKGIAARARCGFGAYFDPGKYIDHWVTEYFDEGRGRWRLVDSQLDARQRELFKIGFDPLDVPRDQFLVAGDAWQLCRTGQAPPDAFGIMEMHGLWFIAGNVIRDLAALNNREMLPWDVWGGMTRTDADLDLAFIDRLAALSREPDAHAEALREAYEDQRLAVPGTVFNAVLNRPEAVH